MNTSHFSLTVQSNFKIALAMSYDWLKKTSATVSNKPNSWLAQTCPRLFTIYNEFPENPLRK